MSKKKKKNHIRQGKSSTQILVLWGAELCFLCMQVCIIHIHNPQPNSVPQKMGLEQDW